MKRAAMCAIYVVVLDQEGVESLLQALTFLQPAKAILSMPKENTCHT
jgi:hypothetical protein